MTGKRRAAKPGLPRLLRLRRARIWLLSACVLTAFVYPIADAVGRSVRTPTLVVDNSFALDTLDPQRAFDPTSIIVDRAIYDTLFTYKAGASQPVPQLVHSWKSKGSKRFTLQLKKNVHFADGTPMTAADVVFSLRRLINLKGNPSFLLDGVAVSSPDKHTVVLRTSTPEPQLPAILASTETGIVNSKLVKAHGGRASHDASTTDTAEQWLNSGDSVGAGSGPYALQTSDRTSQITLRRSPNYWGSAKKPPFGTVVIRNMPAPTQALNIRRGGHQIAIDLSSAQAKGLAHDKHLHVTRQPSAWTFYLYTHNSHQVSSVTPNRRFQRAVRYAVDYEALRSLAGPGAIQAAGLIPSMIPGHLSRRDAAKRNVSKAKANLAASGVGDKQVTLEYPSDLTINGVSFATVAQKVQANLRAVGVNVAISGSPVATLQPRFRAGKVAFSVWAYVPDYLDPADYGVFLPGQLLALHVGWTKGSDPAIEKLAAKAAVTTGRRARAALYRRIQRGMNARSPFKPLIQPAQVFVATRDLGGATFNPAYAVDLTRISPR